MQETEKNVQRIFRLVSKWTNSFFFNCFCHVLKLRSFNSRLHSALSVVGYHARGQEIGKYQLTNQIAGFSGYRPFTIKEINKYIYIYSFLILKSNSYVKQAGSKAGNNWGQTYLFYSIYTRRLFRLYRLMASWTTLELRDLEWMTKK